ncbi:hypothetical protein [Amycolatopsis tolypomycina]|uniref:hypothetical protein n=1 Tax=Amycolatopsis tolypomycina TaxID=208445 RepID=UPI0033AA2C6A
MNKFLTTVGYLAGRGKKALAALVGAIAAVGGIAVIAPNLPPQLQASITGVVAILAVLCGPANNPKSSAGEKQEGESQ